MASSIGRARSSVTGKALIRKANRAGSLKSSADAHSRSSPALTPVSPIRLCKWLDMERAPRGCVTAAMTLSCVQSGARSSIATARPSASIRSRKAADKAYTRLPSMPVSDTTNSPWRGRAPLSRAPLVSPAQAMATDFTGWPA
ncbi:hypothetical protein D3C71_1276860 [compost metagenome]